tara:strand:+ start:1620 stop:2186 length:567 start_codon:yes stop_codon:yes gene_type:complete
MDNFIYEFNIDDKICDGLIEYHKNNTEHKFEGHIINQQGKSVIDKDYKESMDVQFYRCSNDPVIKKYFEALHIACAEYAIKYDLNNYDVCFTNLIQHYPKNGGFKQWHNERGAFGDSKDIITNRGLVYTTYLNDINDKGETEFKYQNLKIKPVKGKSIIFPTDFTHTHRGIPSPTEEKLIATGWFILL